MYAKIRNGLGGNCQWLASMFETNVIEASDILCRNFRSALYNISCYAYGADPEYNQDLIDEGWLPEERAANCEYEYYQIDYSWSYLLDSFTNGFFDSSN